MYLQVCVVCHDVFFCNLVPVASILFFSPSTPLDLTNIGSER